ncbi:MAG: FtsW/RodA/SpoVE family cell cycle protein [Bacteroidales bacterium]|nr:FtsW/RodA/SpoVE family cell cycle protein [Bacteroidales bacterium]
MELLNRLFKGDKVIWIIFMLLCVVSVVEGFSAMGQLSYRTGNYWAPIIQHSTYLLAGLGVVLLLHNVPYKYFSALIILLPVAAFLLIITMLVGEKVNSASRWLTIFGISFQPSEFAKLSLMVFTAFMLSKKRPDNENAVFWRIIGVSVVICALIFKDNLSTAAMLFGVVFLMLFIGRLKLKKLFLLGLSFLLAGVLFVLFLKALPDSIVEKYFYRFGTWISRVDDFRSGGNPMNLDDTYQINDDNFQVSHAKIAVARGGVIGRFPGHSQERDFLPQPFSDFIYAIIMEELGLIGGFFVMMLYFWLLFRIGLIAGKCKHNFARYLLFGCSLILVTQALANMAVAVNLIPVTGQPLPLISRGGTSIIITCVYFGIILSVSRFEIGLGENEEESSEDVPVSDMLPQDLPLNN